jgi:hypothetical protein
MLSDNFLCRLAPYDSTLHPRFDRPSHNKAKFEHSFRSREFNLLLLLARDGLTTLIFKLDPSCYLRPQASPCRGRDLSIGKLEAWSFRHLTQQYW